MHIGQGLCINDISRDYSEISILKNWNIPCFCHVRAQSRDRRNMRSSTRPGAH